MGITTVSLLPATHGFAINAISADLTGTEELVAAPSAGSLYLRHLSIICAVKDITVTIGAGETASAVTTVIIGPVPFIVGVTDAGYIHAVQHVWNFAPAIKLVATTSLTVDASGAGQVQIFVQGYTK